jgi:hypothetical protein
MFLILRLDLPDNTYLEDYPSFDDVEAVGLDGTTRMTGGEPYTWKDLAMMQHTDLWRR